MDASPSSVRRMREDAAGDDSESSTPSTPVTRLTRSRLRAPSAPNDSPVATPPRTRQRRRSNPDTAASPSTSTEKRSATATSNGTGNDNDNGSGAIDKKKAGDSRGGTSNGVAAGEDDAPGDFIHVNVGDCVQLDSGDANDHYIALVSSVQRSVNQNKPGQFTAQWYYKPVDVREEVLALIPGGVLENEVFLSPHKDKNSMDAVLGICFVVGLEEYDELQRDLKRGFREKGAQLYFVCRYKYYPSRPVKKALEIVRSHEIHSGLGRQKPKVGESHQAQIPDMLSAAAKSTAVTAAQEADQDNATDKSSTAAVSVPWRDPARSVSSPDVCRQVWSPKVLDSHGAIVREFHQMADTMRYAVGNVVKVFSPHTIPSGHVRALVLKYVPTDSVRVCLASGQVLTVLKSDVCSPLGDDVVLNALYEARFNVCEAMGVCCSVLGRVQARERLAFEQEAQLLVDVRGRDRDDDITTNAVDRKRRK